MASVQKIRKRIKSISSIHQITKAMEMVAASKMRKAQLLATRALNYSQIAESVLRLLDEQPLAYRHPLFKVKNPRAPKLLITITSDKGLAGSYNALILRQLLKFTQENKSAKIVAVGKKAGGFLKRLDVELLAHFDNIPSFANEDFVNPISQMAIKGFIKGDFSAVNIIYTKFISTIRQTPMIVQFLPIQISAKEGQDKVNEKQADFDKSFTEYQFEPNPRHCLEVIIPRLIKARFYQMFLDSLASEHSARMMAMKNATDSAGDIIHDLTLTYNSVRQASITQELLEIVAGAQ